jgi:hypothetical protein
MLLYAMLGGLVVCHAALLGCIVIAALLQPRIPFVGWVASAKGLVLLLDINSK